ncbi:hypothetical protein ONS95_005716 [Cadophora gregata]|uniref:uncharacterized protein n=1 Tax=Cadophora gregata TaxID=51156 RepID=UPI0026DBFBE3|nr:uncharacterized protein ONS95_005716 [Cadophora gregata]KAK0103709.1 hypothetical protein ONS95_005716 [Cadophora gregata]KAK0107899.1 hypothetical protein ONS96_003686 [Cadophora gregata f. sp. sojae]
MVYARSPRRSRPSFRPSQPRTRASSTSSSSSGSDDGLNILDTAWTDTIGGVTIHLSKLGGSNMDRYPRCAVWKADMKVYLDAKGMGDYIRADNEGDNFTYIEEEVLAKMDRERKAMIWFSVEEKLRKEHLLDLCERDKTSEDVWRRIHERFGGDKPYEPLPELSIDEEV